MAKIKIKKNKKSAPKPKEVTKEDDNMVVLPPVRMSDDPTPRQVFIYCFCVLGAVI